MITILTCLLNQGLLGKYRLLISVTSSNHSMVEMFLPFDLEALVISATNVLVAPALYPQTKASLATWAQKAFAVFDELSRSGNIIAQVEQAELQQLGEMVESVLSSELPPTAQTTTGTMTALPLDTAGMVGDDVFTDTTTDMALDDDLFGAGFSAAQIMDMVNSINRDQSDWMLEEVVDRVL